MIAETNEAIERLNVHLGEHANELYYVPPEPRPAHIERMIADMDALVESITEELEDNRDLVTAYVLARKRLVALRVCARRQWDDQQEVWYT